MCPPFFNKLLHFVQNQTGTFRIYWLFYCCNHQERLEIMKTLTLLSLFLSPEIFKQKKNRGSINPKVPCINLI